MSSLSFGSYKLLKWFACIVLCICFLAGKAQHFALEPGKRKASFRFQLTRDMIIVPVYINSKGPFNFVLDTGVGIMIITDPKLVDSLNINNKRTIRLSGYGNDQVLEAYATSALNVLLPGLHSSDVSAAIFKQDHFGLSNYAGMPIHGLLGFEFFNQLSVKIEFNDSTITVAAPGKIRPFKKGLKLPISIEDRKPYLTTCLTLANGKAVERKLIVDLGAGHPVSLEKVQPDTCFKSITANLGFGLTGPIYGAIGRINEIELGSYKLKSVVTSFPDSAAFVSYTTSRDGNLGLGVLKKFSLIFDYYNQALYIKSNYRYKEPFEHDMSGLEYYATGSDLKRVIISRVEPGSAGADVGLAENDEITAINFKPVSKMSMVDIDDLLKSKNERKLLVEVLRDKKHEVVVLTLRRRI